MTDLLSNLFNNLAEKIHKIKCIYGQNNGKCERCRVKYKDWECYLEYASAKDDLILYK